MTHIDFLLRNGLNLFAVLACAKLPEETQQALTKEGVSLSEYKRLVLLGNGGGKIWAIAKEDNLDSADPIDEFSAKVASEYIERYLGGAPSRILYPGPTRISLMRLGELAGWSHSSPLGLGINPEYGLWFAYRAAFVTSALLPITPPLDSPHPCHSCAEKPCISACPANAVSAEKSFAISTCYDFRVSSNSPCVDRCLSRLACPVGRQHHYSTAQMQHHYDLSRRI